VGLWMGCLVEDGSDFRLVADVVVEVDGAFDVAQEEAGAKAGLNQSRCQKRVALHVCMQACRRCNDIKRR